MEYKNILMFATSNRGKVESANKYFEGKIQFLPCDFAFHEIRSNNLDEIAIAKVLEAYEITKTPTIALDAGFCIKVLHDFPGSYVNYVLSTINIDGLLKLMDGVADRECCFKQCLAYYDGKEEPKVFWGNHQGILSEKKKGNIGSEDWSELSHIFIPKGFDKTLAEMSKEERALARIRNDNNISAFEEFKSWYVDYLASESRYRELQCEQQWKRVCDYIIEEKLMAKISYETWIRPLKIKECTSECLRIEYVDDMVSDIHKDTVRYIKSRYGKLIFETYNLCTESNVQRIECCGQAFL